MPPAEAGAAAAFGLPRRALWLALAVVLGFIVYGSLYPFTFVPPAADPWAQIAAELRTRAGTGRGDFVANIALYMPVGLLAVALLPAWLTAPGRLLAAALLAGLLSMAMEAGQAFVPGRVSSVFDVVLNLSGAAAGALVGLLAGGRAAPLPRLLPGLRAEPFLALLLAAWLAYRFYPFVLSIDLSEWRQSLRRVVLVQDPEWPRLFRLSVAWLVFAWLFQQISGPGGARWLAPLIVLGTTAAAVPIAGRSLTFAEVLAAGLAVLAWAMLPPRARAAPLLFLLLAAAIAVQRLEPFDFRTLPRDFGWMPFRSFMHGQLEVGFQAMAQKAFLYGALLWLGRRAGLPLWAATLFGAALLFGTSYAQAWMPQRPAEITDVVYLLGLAALMRLLRPVTPPEAAGADDAGPARASRAPPRP